MQYGRVRKLNQCKNLEVNKKFPNKNCIKWEKTFKAIYKYTNL